MNMDKTEKYKLSQKGRKAVSEFDNAMKFLESISREDVTESIFKQMSVVK